MTRGSNGVKSVRLIEGASEWSEAMSDDDISEIPGRRRPPMRTTISVTSIWQPLCRHHDDCWHKVLMCTGGASGARARPAKSISQRPVRLTSRSNTQRGRAVSLAACPLVCQVGIASVPEWKRKGD